MQRLNEPSGRVAPRRPNNAELMNVSRRAMISVWVGVAVAWLRSADDRVSAADSIRPDAHADCGFAPGGGVDSNARLISRHLAASSQDSPNIVVQNMEGGGRCGSLPNHVNQRVTADGLTIAVRAVPGMSKEL